LDDSQDFVSKAGEGEDYEMATERPSWDIERFLTAIESLRVHRNASGAARKKPLLLLLILSKLHHRQLTQNRIRFSDLESELSGLITEFGGRNASGGPKPEQPFYHLSSSQFWQLRVPEGIPLGSRRTLAVSILRRPDVHAELDGPLFDLLVANERDRWRAVASLLSKWNEQDAHRLSIKLGFDPIRAMTG